MDTGADRPEVDEGAVVEQIDDGVLLHDPETGYIVDANRAAVDIYGYPVPDLCGMRVAELSAPDPTYDDARARTLIEAAAGGDPQRFDWRIERPDGERRWVNVTLRPATVDGVDVVVAVVRDVTTHKRHERLFRELQSAAAALTGASSVAEIYSLVAGAAVEAFGATCVVCYRYDRASGELSPTALAPGDDDPEDLPPITDTDSVVWRSFAEGLPRHRAAALGPERSVGPDDPAVDETLLLPVGSHGVLLLEFGRRPAATETASDTDGRGAPATDATGATDATDATGTTSADGRNGTGTPRVARVEPESERGVEFASLLALLAEVTLDRAVQERALAERERRLARRDERLDALGHAVELLGVVVDAVVSTPTVARMEQAVCDDVTTVEPVAFAWIGETDRDRTVVPRRCTDGDAEGADWLDDEPDHSPSGVHPARAAVETGEIQHVGSLVEDCDDEDWARRALARGYQSTCAIPLCYRNASYGVLKLYATTPGAFEAIEESLSLLGSLVAFARSAGIRRRALTGDRRTELTLRLTGAPDFALRVATRLDCRVELVDGWTTDGDTADLTLRLPTSVAEDALALAERTATIRAAETVDADGGDYTTAVRLRQDGAWLGTMLADHGGRLEALTATPEAARVEATVPSGVDPSTVVDALDGRYGTVELQRQLSDERGEWSDGLADLLTDRQREVLETAVAHGYFASPRETDAETVAGHLGISQPTFSEHLRTAERRLFTALFGDDD
ncbi:bacterio-opsin activator domain-containing protein [Salinirubrum litoreum]|uniref:Bacterio-opsin activator domain-containing protein n=1 Tax=Salinirubrum litoreum TaxID=1126234 RepID=A0ABD5R796_9EURY|nr:bacterio-opsin activator domain-containing protein [Salinirubrum litoreum]